MLNIEIQQLRDVTVIRCVGRLVIPDTADLRNAVLRQRRNLSLVLDLADVTAIDAAGLGMLVFLRAWSQEAGVTLKLTNVTPYVEQLLALANLRSALEVCSVREMLALLCSAIHQTESVGRETVIQNTNRIDESLNDGSLAIANEALHIL